MTDPGTTTFPPTARGCVQCGAINPPAARFCANCGAALPLPTSIGSTSVSALLDDAHEHLSEGRWEEAGLAAEAVLALEPDSAEAHNIAARARWKQGMRDSAINHAERAVALDPANPDYYATLAAVRGDVKEPLTSRLSPAVIASAVALVVLLVIVTYALRHRTEQPEIQAQAPTSSTPSAPASPFSRTGQPAVYPQGTRPTATTANKPRIPARSTPPGPAQLAERNQTAAAGNVTGAAGAHTPGGSPTTPAGLAPAPVDASTLRSFPAPASGTPAPARTSTPRASTPRTAPTRTASAAGSPFPAGTSGGVPTFAQPGGGTVFGTTPPAVMPGPAPSTPTTLDAFGNPVAAAPATTSATATRVSPQAAYVQRDYGAAIQGYERQIASGNATGSAYQQLALSYERVGDTKSAAQAYQNAIAAYRAQIAAGQDVDLANRGLRTCTRALQMLGRR